MGSIFSKQNPPAQNPPLNSHLHLRRYRAAVIGLEGAGKSNIIRRLCPRKDSPSPFLLESIPTSGVNFYFLPHEALSPLKHHHHYVPPPSPSPIPKTTCFLFSSPSADKNNKDTDKDSNNNTTSPSPSLDTATTNTPKEQQDEHPEEPPPSDAKSIKLLFFDLSGSPRYRSHLRYLAKQTQALIYVLDATAPPARFQESRQFLRELLEECIEGSYKIPLLVYANKMDSPEARTLEEVRDWLALGQWTELGWGAGAAGGGGDGIGDGRWEEERRKKEDRRVWRLQGASAATGEGLMEGIDWLVVQLEVQRCEKDREEDARQRGSTWR